MYLMYIDESGNTGTDYTDKEQPFFTMCGVIVKDTDWIKIDNEIKQLKKDLFNMPDIEIHAALMYNPRRNTPFWGQRAFTDNLEALKAIVDFMIKTKLKIVCSSIAKQNIKNHIGQDVKVDPYYIGLVILSYLFDICLNSTGDRGSIITDKIDSIDENMTYRILNMLRLPNEYKINNIIERPLKADSSLSNMIQLADVAAFCISKAMMLKKPYNSKQQSIVKLAEILIPSICNLYNDKTGSFAISEFEDLLVSNVAVVM